MSRGLKDTHRLTLRFSPAIFGSHVVQDCARHAKSNKRAREFEQAETAPEDDNLDAKGEGEAGTVDGNAAHARFNDGRPESVMVVV